MFGLSTLSTLFLFYLTLVFIVCMNSGITFDSKKTTQFNEPKDFNAEESELRSTIDQGNYMEKEMMMNSFVCFKTSIKETYCH